MYKVVDFYGEIIEEFFDLNDAIALYSRHPDADEIVDEDFNTVYPK